MGLFTPNLLQVFVKIPLHTLILELRCFIDVYIKCIAGRQGITQSQPRQTGK